ncbi:MAG: hypothetical protein PUB93_07475 [Firmicutes bacterium]|nr:hypothetical protein [Bacillota bacterium]
MGKKKEKITYIDDGRTIADMSGVSHGFSAPRRKSVVAGAGLKEQLRTFWGAMKMMFLPTLAVAGGMLTVYLILALIFWLQAH